MTSFAVGDRVRLHGLRKTELNDCEGDILQFIEDASRYAVRLDDNKGDVRVRPENLMPAATVSNDTPSTRAAPSASAPIDATLYVSENGQFIQPAARAPPVFSEVEAASDDDKVMTHRLPLPAGYWQVRLVEQDKTKVTVH